MNWLELAIGFAAGCGYSQMVGLILDRIDRRAQRRQGAGR